MRTTTIDQFWAHPAGRNVQNQHQDNWLLLFNVNSQSSCTQMKLKNQPSNSYHSKEMKNVTTAMDKNCLWWYSKWEAFILLRSFLASFSKRLFFRASLSSESELSSLECFVLCCFFFSSLDFLCSSFDDFSLWLLCLWDFFSLYLAFLFFCSRRLLSSSVLSSSFKSATQLTHECY